MSRTVISKIIFLLSEIQYDTQAGIIQLKYALESSERQMLIMEFRDKVQEIVNVCLSTKLKDRSRFARWVEVK